MYFNSLLQRPGDILSLLHDIYFIKKHLGWENMELLSQCIKPDS